MLILKVQSFHLPNVRIAGLYWNSSTPSLEESVLKCYRGCPIIHFKLLVLSPGFVNDRFCSRVPGEMLWIHLISLICSYFTCKIWITLKHFTPVIYPLPEFSPCFVNTQIANDFCSTSQSQYTRLFIYLLWHVSQPENYFWRLLWEDIMTKTTYNKCLRVQVSEGQSPWLSR